MWLSTYDCHGGTAKFFRLSFGYGSLKNYYITNFSLLQHHKYSLGDIENMIPWERDLYVGMLVAHITEENEKIKQRNKGK